MPAVFEKLGIRFMYPDNWTLDEADALGGDAAVTVYSPTGVAFWSIVVHDRHTEPGELTRTALAAMKETYTELEAEPVQETVQGQDLKGFDLNFYCLDLTNTAWLRAFRSDDVTCLILCQAEDREFGAAEPVFRAMTTSLLTPR